LVIQDTNSSDQYQFNESGRTIISNKKGDFYKAAKCTLLAPKYDPNDYRGLHLSLPKNEAYEFFQITRADWMKWNKLNESRSILDIADERLEAIRPYLDTIRDRISAYSPDAKVYLTGSWLDGSWATIADLQSEAEVVTLREKLFGKKGSSDIDIVVDLPRDQRGLIKAIEQDINGHYGAFEANVTFGALGSKQPGIELKK
jgi:predicted nucleotidyltransferase